MSSTRKGQFGFTIVELLIVIVVIGILAAITIVAYNGIQDRANMAKTSSALSAYAKTLTSYAVDNSGYPPVSGCLGGANNKGSRCLNMSDTGGAVCFGINRANNTSSFDAAIEPYMTSSAPMVSTQRHACGGTHYAGGFYYSGYYGVPPVNSVPRGYFYVYFKEKQGCPDIGGVTIYNSKAEESVMQCMYALPTLNI